MDSILTEGSGKIIALFCGLAVNLIFNIIGNKDILSSTENKRHYYSIWILSGLFFISISYFSRVAEQLSLVFYAGIGLSVPQVGLLLMTINDLKEKVRTLEMTTINDLMERVKSLEGSLEKFNNVLYAQDIPEAVKDKEKFGCNHVIEKALKKQRYYIQIGIFDSEKAKDYLVSIKIATECYGNGDKLVSQVD